MFDQIFENATMVIPLEQKQNVQKSLKKIFYQAHTMVPLHSIRAKKKVL